MAQDEPVGTHAQAWGFESRLPAFTRLALVGVWLLGGLYERINLSRYFFDRAG